MLKLDPTDGWIAEDSSSFNLQALRGISEERWERGRRKVGREGREGKKKENKRWRIGGGRELVEKKNKILFLKTIDDYKALCFPF